MRVVVVGSGAREHALIRKLSAENSVNEVLAVGANAGIANDAEILAPEFHDVRDTVDQIKKARVNLVVIGPEAPLVSGLADSLRAVGIKTFGPNAAASQLESSKLFAKQVMAAANVATAHATKCDSYEAVEAALASRVAPFVVKDDSLASGKGVVVTEDLATALDHARAVLSAGKSVLVEDFLPGVEASLFFVCDGSEAVPLMPARDHKRLLSGDLGPNTGGMGAYAPLPDFSIDRSNDLVAEIARPILTEMRNRGTPFVGLLYAGLMVNEHEINIVEFNVRFGDPETQPVLALMTSSLGELLLAAATEDLKSAQRPEWSQESALTVVMAAPGYPDSPLLGGEVSGLARAARAPNVTVLHAGTGRTSSNAPSSNDLAIVTGGRVLSVTAVGDDLAQARSRAYHAVDLIDFDGAQYRTDIGLSSTSRTDAITTETIVR